MENVIEIPQEKPANPNRWSILGIIALGVFMSTLDSSIMNVALPHIMSDFGAGVNDIQWVLTSYMIAFAVLMPLTAWLRDMIGYKNIFLGGIFLFTLGSFLCSISFNLPSLVLSRILQALGGGVISTTSLAMIAEIFSKKERNMAISIYGMGVLIGPASGPTLGGYLTNAFGWRSVFMINIPIGIITVLLGMEIIERDQPKGTSGKKFDIYGYLTLITFIISLMLAMSKGEDDGWTSPEIIMYFLTALISFTLFLFIESKVKDKIIELSLFKIPTLTAGLAVTIGRSLTLYCAMFMTPLFVQQQLGYSSFQSGLLFLPSDIFLVFAMPLIGKFGDKFSPRLLGILGLSLLSVSMLLYTNINIDTNQWGLLTATFIRALGQAMLMGPMGALILSSVPKEKTAMTSSLFSMIMYVAGSLGIALFGSLLTNRAHFHLGVIGQAFNAGTVSFNSILADVFNQIHGLGFSGVDSTLISKSLIIQKVTQAATILSFQDSFLVAGMIPLLLILTTFMLPGKAKHTDKKSMAPAGK